jgi:hypothetical protein
MIFMANSQYFAWQLTYRRQELLEKKEGTVARTGRMI